jgi:hypothetical protein
MARYTFTCEHTNIFDEDRVTSKLTSEFRADDLNSVLEEVEMFLKGSGFHFDGVLDVVKPEEESIWNDEEIEMFSEPFETNVMPHLVNDLLNPPSFSATRLTGQNAN